MTFTVTIDGNAVYVQTHSLEIDTAVNQRSVMRAIVCGAYQA